MHSGVSVQLLSLQPPATWEDGGLGMGDRAAMLVDGIGDRADVVVDGGAA